MQISKKTEVLMYLLMCPVNFTNSPPFHVWAPPRSLQDIRKGRVCPPRVVHRSHYTLEKVWRHLKLKLRWGPFLKDMFCCRKRLWCLKICRYMLGPKVFYTHFNTPKMYHFQVEIHWRWEWTSIDYVYIYIYKWCCNYITNGLISELQPWNSSGFFCREYPTNPTRHNSIFQFPPLPRFKRSAGPNVMA